MQKTSILCFTIIITFAKSTAGAVIPRNTHLADFRGFGANGCVEQNLGVWTIIDTDIQPGECKGFNGETVKALTLSDLNDGCKSTFRMPPLRAASTKSC